jgi:hypothetical protein
MTELEKVKQQLMLADVAFGNLQETANHDRKLTKDGKMNGHYVKALQELDKVKKHFVDLVERAERAGK